MFDIDRDVSSKEYAETVAEGIYNTLLSDEDKEYLKEHVDPFSYHFSLGMAIRNSCIYPYLRAHKFTDDDVHEDDVTTDIVRILIEKAKQQV